MSAPPERGKANAAVENLLADALGLPREAIQILRGHTGAHKILEIHGIEEPELRKRVSEKLE